MKVFLVPALLALAFVVGCDKPNRIGVNGPGSLAGGGGQLDPNVAAEHQVQTYAFHQVKDGQTIAYTYLMPAGWQDEDSITWVGTTLRYPIAGLITHSPDRQYALAVYPMLAGNSSNGPTGSTGESYQNAADAIAKIMAKNQRISNFQIIHTDTMQGKTTWPEGMGGQGQADMAITRCSFTEEGVQKEGIIVAKLDNFTTANQYTSGTLWHLSLNVMSAPTGQLATRDFMRMAVTFFASASITPEYNKLISDVSFAASQINRKVALEEDNMIMKNYWNQQKSMEKGAQDFDDYIRDVMSFTNPNGGPALVLPANGNYWIDPQGNIQNSPDKNYDPNQGGGNWQQLNPNPG